MGRPPLPLGTHGAIRSYQDAPKTWRSRTLVRDYDGLTREVQRKGATKGQSRRLLAEALRDRVYVGAGDLTADSKGRRGRRGLVRHHHLPGPGHPGAVPVPARREDPRRGRGTAGPGTVGRGV
jgi:hypothetical protein